MKNAVLAASSIELDLNVNMNATLDVDVDGAASETAMEFFGDCAFIREQPQSGSMSKTMTSVFLFTFKSRST